MKKPSNGEAVSKNSNFFCESRGIRVQLLACPACSSFPCEKLDVDQRAQLDASPYLELAVSGLLPRKIKMFVIKYKDGSYKEVEDLDPLQPDLGLLEGIEVVYQVSKEWVPQLVLRPKPKQERKKILSEAETARAQARENSDSKQDELPPMEPELIQVSFL